MPAQPGHQPAPRSYRGPRAGPADENRAGAGAGGKEQGSARLCWSHSSPCACHPSSPGPALRGGPAFAPWLAWSPEHRPVLEAWPAGRSRGLGPRSGAGCCPQRGRPCGSPASLSASGSRITPGPAQTAHTQHTELGSLRVSPAPGTALVCVAHARPGRRSPAADGGKAGRRSSHSADEAKGARASQPATPMAAGLLPPVRLPTSLRSRLFQGKESPCSATGPGHAVLTARATPHCVPRFLANLWHCGSPGQAGAPPCSLPVGQAVRLFLVPQRVTSVPPSPPLIPTLWAFAATDVAARRAQ